MHIKTLTRIAAAIAAFLVLAPTTLLAQAPKTQDVIEVETIPKPEGIAPGWHPRLRLSANFALGNTGNVPGAEDGTTLNFGYMIDGGLVFLSDNTFHEWNSALKMQLAYTKSPLVDALAKGIDTIDFRTAYLYHIPKVRWMGPFLAFRMTAPMLRGYVVRGDDTNVLRLKNAETQQFSEFDPTRPVDADGNTIDANHPSVENVKAGQRIALTEAFAPLTLKESAGLFLMPLEKPTVKLDIRLGFGAWETFVQGGYNVDDNKDTTELLELRQMQDSVQLGPQGEIVLNGIAKEMFTYSAAALIMQPIYNNAVTDLSGKELTNVEFDIGLGIAITSWMSIDYSFKAYRQPLIIEGWQTQHNLLFSLAFDIVSLEAAIVEETHCDCPTDEPAPEETAATDTPVEEAPAVEPPVEEPPAE